MKSNNDENFIGRGLNCHQLVQRAHKTQVERAHVYINALNTGDAFLEESVLDEANTFQPNPSDKHHYIGSQTQKVRSLLHKTHKYFPLEAQVQMNMHTNTQANVPQENTTSQQVVQGDFFEVPQEVEDTLLKTCIPTVVKYQTSYQRCETCKYKWDINYMEMPHNIIFRMKTS